MKKIFLTGFAGMFLLLAVNIPSNGQLAIPNTQPQGDFASLEKSAVKIESEKVSQKAVRDLAKSFKNLSGENWFKVRDGFVAMFTVDEIDHQVSYDKKGTWLFTIRSYGESKLSDDIRHMVKSSYYDLTLTWYRKSKSPPLPKLTLSSLQGRQN